MLGQHKEDQQSQPTTSAALGGQPYQTSVSQEHMFSSPMIVILGKVRQRFRPFFEMKDYPRALHLAVHTTILLYYSTELNNKYMVIILFNRARQ